MRGPGKDNEIIFGSVSHLGWTWSKGTKFGEYVFKVCCVNENVFVRCHIPTTSYSTEIIY